MKRSPMPQRTAGFPRRTSGLAAQSAKGRAGKAEQRVAYAGADDAGQDWCAACERVGPTEHAHLYTQKLYPEHRNNPLNWLKMCRQCHECQENNKPLFAKKYPAAWAEIIRRMQAVDLKAYDFYAATNPLLYPD